MADEDVFDDIRRDVQGLNRDVEILNENLRTTNRLRDERGRFMADDSEPLSTPANSFRDDNGRLRDERGRFMSEEEQRRRGLIGGGSRLRDERGRFISDQGWDWSTSDPVKRQQFEKMFDDAAKKKAMAANASGRGFSRNDVNDVRGTLELIAGDVSAGNIKDAAAILTGGKSDSFFRRISGPLAIGTMGLQMAMQAFESRTNQIQTDAQLLASNIDFAKNAGLSGETRQAIERAARNTVRQQIAESPTYSRFNVIGRGASWVGEKLFGIDTEGEVEKTQELEKKYLANTAKAMDVLDEFDVSSADVITRARGMRWNSTGVNKTEAQLTAQDIRDAKADFVKNIDPTELSNVIAKRNELNNIVKKQIDDERERRKLNPMYEILKRNEEGAFRAQERNRNLAFTDWNKI
jgi:hypothetical protein